jgi:hypothetical protein
MDCARKYYFKKILRIESDSKEHNDREFGIAIHSGIAHLLLNKDKLNAAAPLAEVSDAYEVFLAEYRKYFGEATDEQFYPKCPAGALHLLALMAAKIPNMDIEEVLYVETPGIVPISEDEAMPLRIDAIVRGKRGYYAIDHKTSKKASTGLEWSMNIQIGLYIHMLYSLYPPDQVWGAMINNLVISATKSRGLEVEQHLVPIRKTPRQMQMWYATTRQWLAQLHRDEDYFSSQHSNEELMTAFPMNWQSCTKYWGCPYQPFCLDIPNPALLNLDQIVGFRRVVDDRDKQDSNTLLSKRL